MEVETHLSLLLCERIRLLLNDLIDTDGLCERATLRCVLVAGGEGRRDRIGRRANSDTQHRI